jgi:hypothetical protein
MNHTLRILLASVCAAALPAGSADKPLDNCAAQPGATGMHARVNSMREQIERVPVTPDREKQQRLLELHAKHMREGMLELRRRHDAIAPGCRMELMQALMEQMIAHQGAAHELEGR